MADCGPANYQFPMYADVMHPVVSQGAYGEVTKSWTVDRNIICSFTPAGTAFKEEVSPNVDLTLDSLLVGRTKADPRYTSSGASESLLNVLVTNISDTQGNEIYIETSGPRDGLSTLFEVATIQPFMGPFGKVEYYKVVLRRSESQELTV